MGHRVGLAFAFVTAWSVAAPVASAATLTTDLVAAGFPCPDRPDPGDRARVLATFRPDRPHTGQRLIVGLARTATAGQEAERAKALRVALGDWLARPAATTASPASGPAVTSMHVYPRLDAVLLEFTPDASLSRVAEELAGCPGPIRYVELDHPIELEAIAPNDRFWGEQEALRKMSVDAAWEITTGSRGVVVAVVDNGISLGHVDLADNLWTNACQPTPDPADAPCPGEVIGGVTGDLHGWNFDSPGDAPEPASQEDPHGTKVAGIIGARGDNGPDDCVAGVAWEVSLVALKAKGVADAVKAVQYATAIPADVINASWSAEPAVLLADAITAAGEKEILVVAAAPREDADVDARPAGERRIPCGLPASNVICVTATDAFDELVPGASTGAESVDLSATVAGVRTTGSAPADCPVGNETSSFAAPFVAGVAALLRAKCPGISVAAMRQRLLDGAPALSGLTASGARLDAGKALVAPCPCASGTSRADPER